MGFSHSTQLSNIHTFSYQTAITMQAKSSHPAAEKQRCHSLFLNLPSAKYNLHFTKNNFQFLKSNLAFEIFNLSFDKRNLY